MKYLYELLESKEKKDLTYRHPKHSFTNWECKVLLAKWIPVRDIKRYLNGKITVEEMVWECSASLIKAYILEIEELIDSGMFEEKAVAVLMKFVDKLTEDLNRYMD